MVQGSFVAVLLIVFRESLEAALIVGIILTALSRLGQKRYFPQVVVSSALAVVASLVAGRALLSLAESAQGRWKELIEGAVSLAACGVLTYMIFWMDRQSRRVKSELEAKVEEAVSRKELAAMMTLPFLAVFREGAETVLFLNAVALNESTGLSLSGGLAGFALAVLAAVALFVGGRRVPLRPLFRVSGFFLLLVGAGLLAYGIHEFQELGWLPEIYAPVWDTNPILNEKVGFGAFLKSLFGYNGNPSLLEVLAYGAYLFTIFAFLRSGPSPKPAPSRQTR